MNENYRDRQYTYTELLESQIDPDPIAQFDLWFKDATESGIKYPNAFTLATASAVCKPNARLILLKGFNKNGFVFYTNSESIKGVELEQNPQASMVFWWDRLERQVRINGRIFMVSDEDADEYFQSRPRGSRIGACASKQSEVIESRDILYREYSRLEKEYEGKEIPRPPYWKGYRLEPMSIEFWQGRINRLHDRLRYRLELNNQWRIERLSP